jgi:hypothetical protein
VSSSPRPAIWSPTRTSSRSSRLRRSPTSGTSRPGRPPRMAVTTASSPCRPSPTSRPPLSSRRSPSPSRRRRCFTQTSRRSPRRCRRRSASTSRCGWHAAAAATLSPGSTEDYVLRPLQLRKRLGQKSQVGTFARCLLGVWATAVEAPTIDVCFILNPTALRPHMELLGTDEAAYDTSWSRSCARSAPRCIWPSRRRRPRRGKVQPRIVTCRRVRGRSARDCGRPHGGRAARAGL